MLIKVLAPTKILFVTVSISINHYRAFENVISLFWLIYLFTILRYYNKHFFVQRSLVKSNISIDVVNLSDW